jgi:non-ribosomal peptide synthetase component F
MVPTSTQAPRRRPRQTVKARRFHPRGAFVEFPRAALEQSVPQRFEQQARKHAQRIAVGTKDRTLTYQALNEAANRGARALLARRGEATEPIAVLLDHAATMIVAIMAILKAGKICIPIDPSYPDKRKAYVLEDSRASLVVTDDANLLAAAALGSGLDLLNLDRIDPALAGGNLRRRIAPETLAYITYTSGSTGQPKGVLQDHRGLLHKAMLHTNMLRICERDRLSLLHSCSFAGCYYNLFGALLNGASVFPFDPRSGAELGLARWLSDERITIYHSVPLVFRQMLSLEKPKPRFPELRVINLSGVSMTREDVDLYRKHFAAKCRLVHSLGTTEAGYIRH